MTTTVLVHGVPETAAIWDGVIDVFAQKGHTDVVALSMPGFGVPRPDGFDATMNSYASWLADQVGHLSTDEPIDLVGHDWGGILVAHLVATRPDGIRRWVSDAVGCLQPSYRWHDFAQIWQTPGEGEQFWAGLMDDVAANSGLMAGLGVPQAAAERMAADLDQTMVDSILALYRSAVTIGTDWEIESPPTVPGMVIAGADDPFLTVAAAADGARRLDAEVAIIDGAGHFWPAQRPVEAAAALTAFLSRP